MAAADYGLIGAAPEADAEAQFPAVAPHPAPDNSGRMTNLSDEDYAKFTRGQAPPPTKDIPAQQNQKPAATSSAAVFGLTPAQNEEKPTSDSFGTQLMKSTAAALGGIPSGLLGSKTIDYGNAIVQAPIRMFYGDTSDQPTDQGIYGAQPPQGFRFATPLKAIQEGVRDSEQQREALGSYAPISDIGGQIIGGAAGGVAAAPALARTAISGAAPLTSKILNAADYLARNAAFGGAISAASGGDPTIGAAFGAGLPATGMAVKAIASPAIGAVKNFTNRLAPIWSQDAANANVNNRLNELLRGGRLDQSPVGPLNLAQASNNPDIQALVDTASSVNNSALTDINREQSAALQSQISRLGPTVSQPDASTVAHQAMSNIEDLASRQENELWNRPELKNQPVQTNWLKNSMAQAVDELEPGLKLGLTGNVGRALGLLDQMGPRETVGNLNSVRSALLRIARSPSESNPWEAAVASRLQGKFLDAMDRTLNTSTVDPMVSRAWQTARDFTRSFRGENSPFSYSSVKAAMKSDKPSEALRKFFNMSYGTPEGPEAIDNLATFASSLHDQAGSMLAGTLKAAARGYIADVLRNAGKVEDGAFKVTGLKKMLDTNGAWMVNSGIFEPSQISALRDLSDYVNLLDRSRLLDLQGGSATAKRLIRGKTFTDEIMSPMVRRIVDITASGAVGVPVGHLLGTEWGMMAGGGAAVAVEKSIAAAEDNLKKIMSEAVLDSRVAEALQKNATKANWSMLAPDVRAKLQSLGTAMTADVVPHFVGQPSSPATVEMSQ